MYVDINGDFIETFIAVVVIIAKAVFVASAAVGAYALISNLIDQSSNGSGSNPSQDSSLSSTSQNNSREIASSIPQIPNTGYKLDYGNNFGNYTISPEYNSVANNSISSAIGAATASAVFGSIGNGNNLGGGDGGITTADVVDTALDFVPIAGGAKDIYQGIRDGDGWQVALGAGSIVLDIFTLGSASLVKGAVKTGIKQGVKAYAKKTAYNSINRVSNQYAKTIAKQSTRSLRQKAVRQAWKNEQAMYKATGDGSRAWTRSEAKQLLNNGKVKGYDGHHIFNVKHHPYAAGDPDNIEFLTRTEHLRAHFGNWRNKTKGKLIKRGY
tara:strand:- start:1589 stop:2566 length:978 start_codon:yes stop_codon:yes gene_type:complete